MLGRVSETEPTYWEPEASELVVPRNDIENYVTSATT